MDDLRPQMRVMVTWRGLLRNVKRTDDTVSQDRQLVTVAGKAKPEQLGTGGDIEIQQFRMLCGGVHEDAVEHRPIAVPGEILRYSNSEQSHRAAVARDCHVRDALGRPQVRVE